ncbi:hypothetical protein [Burkholderia sp. Ac-20353]|uniref:hypothetical protein n=1 Tax=Burkholderia sp. Ac-20353 TaxID=2703894 RepID=UPI00197C3238|nr:hypothetical protein [Burkholderia sp. Ac-20353]MBN3787334.1 hypothetical protein [Burkholderia sp. Ac-20353]
MAVFKWLLTVGAKTFKGRVEMVRTSSKRFVAGLMSVHETAVVYTRPAWHYETDALHGQPTRRSRPLSRLSAASTTPDR